MKKRFSIIITLVLAASIFVTACGSSKGSKKAGGDSKETTVEGEELVVSQGADATTLDPQDSNDQPSGRIFRQVYNNLVKYSMDMEIVSDLAKEWEQVDDLTWEFEIFDDVYFHNGEKLTADDVKFTLDRYKTGLVAHMLEPIEEVEVLDEHKFRITTKEPFAALLAHLTHNSAGMLNEKAVKDAGEDYGLNPVGTGPFKFVSWTSGDNIVLEKNEDYFKDKPAVSKITFKVIPEDTQRTIALETDEVDIAYNIGPVDRKAIEENENLELIESPSFAIEYMGINTSKEPFNNILVRQAMTHAINVDEIIATVLEGTGEKAGAPLQANVPGSNPNLKPYDYDLEKAKALMVEAGYPDGFEAELWTNDGAVRVRIAEMIQAELKEIGIDIKVVELEWGAYLEGTETGNQELYMLGWSVSTGDADNGLGSLFHSKNLGPGGNRSFYESDAVDKLLDKGAVEKDLDQRIKYYQEAQEVIMEDLPIVPLYFDTNTAGINSSIKGFEIHPAGHIMLDTVYFE